MCLHAAPRLRFRLSEGWIREKGNGVRSARLWARLLGVEQVVVERVCFGQDEQALVVSVRPRKGVRRRYGRCGRRCPGFDQGGELLDRPAKGPGRPFTGQSGR